MDTRDKQLSHGQATVSGDVLPSSLLRSSILDLWVCLSVYLWVCVRYLERICDTEEGEMAVCSTLILSDLSLSFQRATSFTLETKNSSNWRLKTGLEFQFPHTTCRHWVLTWQVWTLGPWAMQSMLWCLSYRFVVRMKMRWCKDTVLWWEGHHAAPCGISSTVLGRCDQSCFSLAMARLPRQGLDAGDGQGNGGERREPRLIC